MKRSGIRNVWAAAMLLFWGLTVLHAEINFNLPCLAPLLERIDEDAPKSIDEAFIFGPWHSPLARDDVGEVNFPIATGSKDAQLLFNQGIALLHGFSYREAERCFRAALALDDDCPMIFWALAMANERTPARAALFASYAARHSTNRAELSPVERRWLGLLAGYYQGVIPATGVEAVELTPEEWEDRRKAWVQGLEEMAFEFPDDVEIKAFLLRRVILDHYRSGTLIASYYANNLLADQVAELAPNHPSRHYRLLLWLEQNPGRAVDHVHEAPTVAPGLADSWRFAGQLLAAAGRTREAVPYLESCLAVAHRDFSRPWMMPDDVENLVANYEALIDLLTGMGRFEEARAAARQLAGLPRTFYLGKRDTLDDFLGGSFATGRRLLGQLHLRLELWDDLLRECESGGLKAQDGDWFSMIDSQFWRGLALANLGRLDEASAVVEELSNNLRLASGKGVSNRILDLLARQGRTLRTQIEYLDGKRKGPPDRKTDLTSLPGDYIARTYFAAGMKDEALAMIEDEFRKRPGQAVPTANFIDIQLRRGESKQALVAFDSSFRANASEARRGLPVFVRIRPAAEKMRLGKFWTRKAPPLEIKPDMPADGLPEWEFVRAPAWSLPDHANRKVSLADYKGKPVLVNFFLGVSCAFCRVQLDKFRPHVPDFEKAGIPFVAISQDSLEVLQKAMGGQPEKTEEAQEIYPFTVLADSEFEVFRAYGVFSEFEDRAMHGTILIDAKGRVTWVNVGHGPFDHPQMLLNESLRLLDGRDE